MVEPFTELAGDGAAFGVGWRRDEHTRPDFVAKTGSGCFGGGRTRLASLGVTTRRFGTGLAWGREVRWRLVYETGTSRGAALTVGGLLRRNPDRDPEAASELGAAARPRMDF